MYRNDHIDINEFTRNMEALKRENQEFKALLFSKKYKTGQYITDFMKAFCSFSSFTAYFRNIKGKIRWKKLCRKYPISHVKTNKNSQADYFSDKEIIIYTSIFGNYDLPQEPVFKPDNCRFIIFTDQYIKVNSAWEKVDLPQEIMDYNYTNAEKNRFCKMLPHILFPKNQFSIYIDGNVKPVTDLTEFVNRCSAIGIALHMHKSRQCVYEEIEACKILGKASIKALDNFKSFLEQNSFPHNFGMNECNVIVRDHSNTKICRLMEEWWKMFKEGSVKRDQLSFPYLLFKYGIKPSEIGTLGNNVQDNPAIRVTLHI